MGIGVGGGSGGGRGDEEEGMRGGSWEKMHIAQQCGLGILIVASGLTAGLRAFCKMKALFYKGLFRTVSSVFSPYSYTRGASINWST